VIPSLISISRLGSSAGLCFVFPVPVQLVWTSLFQRPGARFSRAFLARGQVSCSFLPDRGPVWISLELAVESILTC
jgi:hypothetical protein